MTYWPLLIFCLVVSAVIASFVSILTGITLPLLDRFARTLGLSGRVALWTGVGFLPVFASFVLIGASLMPALGHGTDHCLTHGGHPHLCPNHASMQPGALTLLLALLASAKLLAASWGVFRSIQISAKTSKSLAQASEEQNGVLVFESDSPSAFVLGALRPRVHASRALLAMGSAVVEPVLAHERAHAKHSDLLWRSLLPVISVGHFRRVANALQSRLVLAQEMRADASAAIQVRSPLNVAEALLALATLKNSPAPALQFTDGDIDSRVRALLASTKSLSRWPLFLGLACAFAGLLFVAQKQAPIHHTLETLIGVLN